MSVKLTDDQIKALMAAASGDGRINRSFAPSGIEKPLAAYELIEVRLKEPEYRRLEMSARRDNFVRDAKEALSADNWHGAYVCLGMAYTEECEMTATCYWITEKGRQVLAAGGVLA